MKVTDLEQALGRFVKCTDGQHRKLERIEPDFLHYAVPLSDSVWQSLGRTHRHQCDYLFIGGELEDQP
jgi:hypothetical protein